MKCPRCEMQLYRHVDIEEDLTALKCTNCEGCWVNSANYWSWHETNSGKEPSVEDGEVLELTERKSEKGKICPECLAILIPGKVGRGHDFRIDRCGHCGGFWFDKNEWEVLRSSGLHREIHKVATHVWQRNIRKEATKAIMRKIYEERFDGETLGRLSEIHKWIHEHPQKDEIVSYLLDDEPYQA